MISRQYFLQRPVSVAHRPKKPLLLFSLPCSVFSQVQTKIKPVLAILDNLSEYLKTK